MKHLKTSYRPKFYDDFPAPLSSICEIDIGQLYGASWCNALWTILYIMTQSLFLLPPPPLSLLPPLSLALSLSLSLSLALSLSISLSIYLFSPPRSPISASITPALQRPFTLTYAPLLFFRLIPILLYWFLLFTVKSRNGVGYLTLSCITYHNVSIKSQEKQAECSDSFYTYRHWSSN